MEGGAFRSASFAKSSHDYVFVHLHQTRPDTLESYRLITREYLPEEFLHPVYFFLRPDGTEADPANRHHHEALSARQMEKILGGIAKKWGRGLSEKEYADATARLDAARAELAAGKIEAARQELEALARLRARCGVKDRARAWLDVIDAAAGLRPAAAAISPAAAARLDRLDLVGAWRGLAKARGEGATKAAEAILAAIRRFVRLDPVRLERLSLEDGTFYYLRAEWATDLLPFDGLTLQLAYLTNAPKSFEGYATWDAVEPFGHHRAAFSMPSVAFRLKDVVNARAQLWLDGVMLSESTFAEEPATFPFEDEQVMTGPDLLEESETLGAWARAKLRDYRLGRYAPAR